MFSADNLYVIPLDQWIQVGVRWLAIHFRPLFQSIKWPVDSLLSIINGVLQAIPFPVLILIVALIAWRTASRGVAVFTLVSLTLIAFIGLWSEAMMTLSLIVTAIVVCIVLAVPTGILCARSDRAWAIIRPILDIMQTTPSFVYLVPVVMLFGVGTVPGGIAVIVAAAPPLVRFTNLGIRQVDAEMVEAARAFGATKRQLLWEVQLPLAMPTILGGLNQTVLMAMVMSVIIAMIGAEGLGLIVLQGLGRLDVGMAAVGGLAIVLLAMILDRITQGLANQDGLQSNRRIISVVTQMFSFSRSDPNSMDVRHQET